MESAKDLTGGFNETPGFPRNFKGQQSPFVLASKRDLNSISSQPKSNSGELASTSNEIFQVHHLEGP